ncbi:MAG: pyridoxal-phosphate dependent enzyme, partial [Pseudomonadota bacterium]
MQYISTRGQASTVDFEGATMAGLAPDGGLYMPAEWPRLEKAVIAGFANMPYAEIAASVLAPFVQNSLDDEEVRTLCETAYGQFHHAAIAPLKTLGHDLWLMELFHGPTLAFKDFALQLLGLLFARFLGASRRHLTILGATSGDTGSAAIHALAGLECIDVFMLHPKDRVSEVQRRQMTTVMTPNIHNIAIEGSFDDAQALVK